MIWSALAGALPGRLMVTGMLPAAACTTGTIAVAQLSAAELVTSSSLWTSTKLILGSDLNGPRIAFAHVVEPEILVQSLYQSNSDSCAVSPLLCASATICESSDSPVVVGFGKPTEYAWMIDANGVGAHRPDDREVVVDLGGVERRPHQRPTVIVRVVVDELQGCEHRGHVGGVDRRSGVVVVVGAALVGVAVSAPWSGWAGPRLGADGRGRKQPVRGGAVAQLPERVVAPAIGGAVGGHRARVEIAGRDRAHAHESGHARRPQGLGGLPVAELTVRVETPTLDRSRGQCARTYGRRRSPPSATPVNPGTVLGVRRLVVVPSPSWP